MPKLLHGIDAADIDRTIHLLIRNLVEIKDTSGEFLLRLDDGKHLNAKTAKLKNETHQFNSRFSNPR